MINFVADREDGLLALERSSR